MSYFTQIAVSSVIGLSVAGHAGAQVAAFEGAEGFGAFATGARTNLSSASVYHVTNLNDSGAGSFRDAVSQSNRFVVFGVSGVINITSPVVVSSNVTIAGQTSPGGVAVYGDKVTYSGANNTISRYMAYRLGTAAGREDASGASNGNNMMFDHMSITWGVDETFSFNWDGKGNSLDNITIQNSIIGQGLDVVGHSAGGLMTFPEGGRFSIIKSLFTDSVTRNPKIRGENEFINNVVYGWETAAYIMGDTNNMESHANAIGNYFIEGPIDGGDPFRSGSSVFHIYGEDNWVDTNRNGVLDGSLITTYPGADVVSTPFAFPTTSAMSAQDALQYVMDHAGLSIIRDAVDSRIIEEVASYGTLGGVIERDSHLFPNYGTDPTYVNVRARFTDADNDGIADNWEAAHGLSASDAADWKNLSADGYTQFEEYVNELGADGETILSSGGVWSNVATWSGAAPTLADDAIVVGSLSHSSGNAFARRLSLNGGLTMSGGTLDVFDTAEFSSGTAMIGGGVATFGRLLVGSTGDTATLALRDGATLQGGTVTDAGGHGSIDWNGATFRATGSPLITLDTTLGTLGGTFDTNGFDGEFSGQIGGEGALTKVGGGTLVLSGDNSYGGGTDVTGLIKLTHGNAAGTGEIKINAAGGKVLLGDGVAVSNDLVTDYIYEVLDVVDSNAAATFAGNISLARSSRQIRVQTTGSNALLILTGDVDAGSSFFIQKTGSVDLRGNGSLSAGVAIIGRDGISTEFTMRDQSSADLGSLSMGGGKTLADGHITVRDNASLHVASNVDLLSTSSSNSFSEFNLDGGSATVNGFVKSSVGASQTSEIDFNGGTLRYGGNGSNADFLPSLIGLTANVQAGGAFFDSNGQDITVSQQLIHDPLVAATDGGLTKLGAGSLALMATNTYNGVTNVVAGKLIVDGSTGSGLTTVQAGAQLGGGGMIAGGLSVSGVVDPGNSPGTLDVNGDATFETGAVLRIEIAGPTDHDQLNVAGTLTLLDGVELQLVLLGDYEPGDTDAWVIAQSSAVAGQFSDVQVIGAEGLAGRVVYNGDAIAVSFVPVPEPSVGMVLLSIPAFLRRW